MCLKKEVKNMSKTSKVYEFKKSMGMFSQSLKLNDGRYMKKSMIEILSSDKRIEKNVELIVRAILHNKRGSDDE